VARRKSGYVDPDEMEKFKRGCEAGHESAFWDAVLTCEIAGAEKPAWVSDLLQRYARDRINGRETFEKKAGRPSSDPTLDVSVFAYVEEEFIFHKGRMSRNKVFQMAKEKFAEWGDRFGDLKNPLDNAAIRAAYKRGKRISEDLDGYYLSDFLDRFQ
jgi:hypothetical protein